MPAHPDNDNSKQSEPLFEKPQFLSGLLGGIVLLAVGYYTVLYQLIDQPERRGQFGDAFGAINSVFTGLAFTVVIYGIILQRREIKLQQREMADTREVFKQQSFETSYFNLQRVLAETIDGITWEVRGELDSGGRNTLRGRRALQAIVEEIYHRHRDRLHHHERTFAHSNLPRELPYDTRVQWLIEDYATFYRCHESLLGNYFRLVYNILKYVSQSEFDPFEKERYAHFFRAQLSEAELTLLVLNGIGPMGAKMRRYLEEFAMLKHATMEGRNVPKPTEHFGLSAFADMDERAAADVVR